MAAIRAEIAFHAFMVARGTVGGTENSASRAPSLVRSMARRGRFAGARRARRVACRSARADRCGGRARRGRRSHRRRRPFIVVDVNTGTVLASDHLHDALPPASTSKIMTALTAVERLAPDALVNVSPLAASQPASRINMQPGQQWPFEQRAGVADDGLGQRRRVRDRGNRRAAASTGSSPPNSRRRPASAWRTARSPTRPASTTRRRTRAGLG